MNSLKKTDRYSSDRRPSVGRKCLFSPGLILLAGGRNILVKPYQPNMMRSKRCIVVENLEHTIRVQFPKNATTDIVSPEFLLPFELTKDEIKMRDELLTTVQKGKKG